MQKEKKYDSKSISVITTDLERVRQKPTMYIGSIGENAILHLIREVLDNSIDEHKMGIGNTIVLDINPNTCEFTIKDEGRGIPCDDNKTVVDIFTVLHSSGKFNQDNYQNSSGLHGVGLTCLTALSQKLTITIFRDGKFKKYTFTDGNITTLPRFTKSTTKVNGTDIHFIPDSNYLKLPDTINSEYILNQLNILCEMYCALNKQLIIDLKVNGELIKKINHPEGISYLLKNKKDDLIPQIYIFNKKISDNEYYSIHYTIGNELDSDMYIHGFINDVFQKNGGTHVDAVKQGFLKHIRSKLKSSQKFTKQYDSLSTRDISQLDIRVVITYYTIDPQFESQEKSGTKSESIRDNINNTFDSLNIKFLKQVEDTLLERIKNKNESNAAKKISSTSTTKLLTSILLKDCTSKNPKDCELYIVEGDSAGNTVLQARNKQTQAVFFLRGVVSNTIKFDLTKIQKNKELFELLQSLGCGIGKSFNIDNLRYHKIFIMTDMDSDGLHIALLLLTFFHTHLPKLIENGHVYYADTPFYILYEKGKEYYARNNEERDSILQKHPKATIKRIKGLGELNASQVKAFTMDIESRVLRPIVSNNMEESFRLLSSVMGDDSSLKRDYME